MARASTRPFTAEDQRLLDEAFTELRAHFHEWPGYESAHALVGFAFYEGCGGRGRDGAILARVAPLAVGQELVSKHGFVWQMVRAAGGWNYAVYHPPTSLFVDLESLDAGSWIDADRFAPAAPGRRAHDSCDAIVRHVNLLEREDTASA